MFGTIVSLTKRRASLMLVMGLLAAVLGATSAEAQPASCSVTNADGGVDVTWQGVADASTYVYRLEVPGENNRYKRVDATSTFIELAEGDVGTVFVSAVFANGSYSPSISCGSGQANDGSGGQPSTCSVASADGGIDASWSYVNGAVEYVYRLEVDGQNNRYQRVMGTTAFIPLNDGVVGTVFVSGVKADGSYTPAVPCGSAQANDGTGGEDPTCASESADGGIRISWSAVPDASSYVYRLEVDGQNNRYGVFPADGDLSGLVQAPAGTVGTLFVSAKFANGSYSSGIACGTATAGGGGGGIAAPASCNSTPVDAPADQSGATISWDAVPGAAGYIVFSKAYRQSVFTETPAGAGATSVFLSIPLWWETQASVAAVDSDGNVSEKTDCGLAEPGTPPGPASCLVSENGSTTIVEWDEVTRTRLYFVRWVENGENKLQVVGGGQVRQYSIPASNVTDVTVGGEVEAGGPGGGSTAMSTTTCSTGGGSGIAGPANCGSNPVQANADESGANIGWDAVPGAAGYVVFSKAYRQVGFTETLVGPNDRSLFLPIPLWWETDVSVSAIDADGNRSAKTSCGRAEPGQPLGPASCSISNDVASWDPVPQAANYVLFWYLNGDENQQGVGGNTSFTLPAGADTVRVIANVVTGGPGGPQSFLSSSTLCAAL